MLVKIVDTVVSTDSVGRPVDAVPIREWQAGETDAAGRPVAAVPLEVSALGKPVRYVAGKTALNSAGQVVDTIPTTGGGIPVYDTVTLADGQAFTVDSADKSWSVAYYQSTDTVRFEVRQDESELPPGSGHERAELSEYPTLMPVGSIITVEFDLTLEPGYAVNSADWFSLMQLHDFSTGGSSARKNPIGIGFSTGDKLQAWCSTGLPASETFHQVYGGVSDLTKGQTYHCKLEVKARPDANGYMKFWLDGVQVGDYPGATCWDDTDTLYAKFGIYRETDAAPYAVRFKGFTCTNVVPPFTPTDLGSKLVYYGNDPTTLAALSASDETQGCFVKVQITDTAASRTILGASGDNGRQIGIAADESMFINRQNTASRSATQSTVKVPVGAPTVVGAMMRAGDGSHDVWVIGTRLTIGSQSYDNASKPNFTDGRTTVVGAKSGGSEPFVGSILSPYLITTGELTNSEIDQIAAYLAALP